MTDAEKLAPFADDFLGAARESGEDPHVVAAICLRESDATHAVHYTPRGDVWGLHADGHGHGLFGIDDRYHAEFCRGGDHSPLGQARKCCAILRADRGYFKALPSVPDRLPGDDFLRIVLAAYNAGPHNARLGYMQHGDSDHFTTGHDYSAWVLAKAADLRATVPLLFPPDTQGAHDA